MRAETSLKSKIVVAAVGTCIRTGGSDSISTVAAEAEIETGEMGININMGQIYTMDVREKTGVVMEAMGIHQTSNTPKTDSGAENTPTTTYVGRF